MNLSRAGLLHIHHTVIWTRERFHCALQFFSRVCRGKKKTHHAHPQNLTYLYMLHVQLSHSNTRYIVHPFCQTILALLEMCPLVRGSITCTPSNLLPRMCVLSRWGLLSTECHLREGRHQCTCICTNDIKAASNDRAKSLPLARKLPPYIMPIIISRIYLPISHVAHTSILRLTFRECG